MIDPATENTIVRLTALTSASALPLPRNRFVSPRERSLLFSSDRTGHFTPHAIDLRTGVIRQLAEANKLNTGSLSFDRQEKAVRYLDGESLFEVTLNHGTPKRLGDGYTAFGNSADGAMFLIAGGKLVRKDNSSLRPLASGANNLWPQPNGAGCLFGRGAADEQEFFYVTADGLGKPVPIAKGHVREPFWDADGQSILFLRDVASNNGTVLAEIHGRALGGGDEYLVSPTSQFASFAPNSDATVFVGASRSKAQPNVVLMLRSPHREMTLCEHHSSHPSEVSPTFSSDNRRVYFESDREGRRAIYSVNVELLVDASA